MTPITHPASGLSLAAGGACPGRGAGFAGAHPVSAKCIFARSESETFADAGVRMRDCVPEPARAVCVQIWIRNGSILVGFEAII